MLHEAMLYDKKPNGQVQCNLCSHRCMINESDRGKCRVRENKEGKLFSRVYGNLLSKNIDPIEKKPLYHFQPGSRSFSIATPGCNFRCGWCQNWQLSQMPQQMRIPDHGKVMPEEIVQQAVESNCQSIAYTYTEPTIFFEYSYDTAMLAKQAGLKNVYVTNGFMTSDMIEMASLFLDAANVDIKAFNDSTYRSHMGGRLAPVLDSCRLMKSLGIWLEITTLIVPGINDSMKEIEDLARFIFDDLGPETPWHLSRFYPQYRLSNIAPTQERILQQAKELGRSIGLNYIYLGNVGSQNVTNCKGCGQELIVRTHFSVQFNELGDEGKCLQCGTKLDGIGVVPS